MNSRTQQTYTHPHMHPDILLSYFVSWKMFVFITFLEHSILILLVPHIGQLEGNMKGKKEYILTNNDAVT